MLATEKVAPFSEGASGAPSAGDVLIDIKPRILKSSND